jgi:hypothetical protein
VGVIGSHGKYQRRRTAHILRVYAGTGFDQRLNGLIIGLHAASCSAVSSQLDTLWRF